MKAFIFFEFFSGRNNFCTLAQKYDYKSHQKII